VTRRRTTPAATWPRRGVSPARRRPRTGSWRCRHDGRVWQDRGVLDTAGRRTGGSPRPAGRTVIRRRCDEAARQARSLVPLRDRAAQAGVLRDVAARGCRPAAPPARGGLILAANHISHLDPIAVCDHVLYDLGLAPRFLAKSTLFEGRPGRARHAGAGRSRCTGTRRTRQGAGRGGRGAGAGARRRALPRGHRDPRPGKWPMRQTGVAARPAVGRAGRPSPWGPGQESGRPPGAAPSPAGRCASGSARASPHATPGSHFGEVLRAPDGDGRDHRGAGGARRARAAGTADARRPPRDAGRRTA
jgi:hypothetical protein